VKLATRDGFPASQLKSSIEDIAADHLFRAPQLIDDFVAGTIDIY
jgi:hypothetical protein